MRRGVFGLFKKKNNFSVTSSLNLQSQDSESQIPVSIPSGMSENSYKRVTVNTPFKPEEFESVSGFGKV